MYSSLSSEQIAEGNLFSFWLLFGKANEKNMLVHIFILVVQGDTDPSPLGGSTTKNIFFLPFQNHDLKKNSFCIFFLRHILLLILQSYNMGCVTMYIIIMFSYQAYWWDIFSCPFPFPFHRFFYFMILGKTESTETVAVESSKDSTENQPRIKVIIAQNQGNTSPESR